jgi:lipopolysaccharide/colanic/teichoic acid biosynthesis glycosyltransferase
MSSLHEPPPFAVEPAPLAATRRGRSAHAAVAIKSAAGRTLDVLLAGTALVLLAPLMLAIVLAIHVDTPGPALFRQRRIGRHMRPFTVLKFRSMRATVDSTPHREYVRALIAGREEQHEGLYKLTVDPRVTFVGRILRKTSLDELPQLWNVLRGEMSVVGPRPVVEYEVECYPSWYLGRFAVRPGITGLWQVSGRNERTYEEMVRLDLDYVERRSVGLDLWIILKTVWVVGLRRGAA